MTTMTPDPWGLPGRVEATAGGLINQTFLIRDGDHVVGVLQRLNTGIFVPEVHEDIEAVTAHLAARDLPTTRIVRTTAGSLWHTDAEGGVWRVLTPVGDRTIDKIADPADAFAAAALVGRFHAALADFSWDFRSVRAGAHDTDRHMARLRAALTDFPDHRLHADVAALADTVLTGWETWVGPRSETLPTRVIHGDLKISNVRFAGTEAHCLIDLDTLAWGTLDIELGDAMRSWCNPASEDVVDAVFDTTIFAAALDGYRTTTNATEAELAAILPGCERICWELAARFAQDALAECYFGWSERFGTRGDHNLLRARGQAALAASVRATR